MGPVILLYLQDGKLPDNDSRARRLVLERSRYELVDGTLHYVNHDGQLRIAVPRRLRDALLREAHDGRFSGHFGEKKVYVTLRKKYWWPGMRADTRRYCRSCLLCAPGKALDV